MQIEMELSELVREKMRTDVAKAAKQKELIGQLEDYAFTYPSALLQCVLSHESLNFDEKLNVVKRFWPQDAILKQELPFTASGLRAYVPFLIRKTVYDFEQKPDSFSDEDIRFHFDLIKQILKKPSSLKESEKKALEKTMAFAMVRVRSIKKPAVGSDFHFVCSALWPYLYDLEAMIALTEYLIKQDISAAFPDNKSKAHLIIMLLSLSKNSAINTKEKEAQYENYIEEVVWPFVQQLGCEEAVTVFTPEGFAFRRISMSSEQDIAEYPKVLQRLADFSIYQGRVSGNQIQAANKQAVEPDFLTFDEFTQKLPLATVVRKLQLEMNAQEDSQKVAGLRRYFWDKARDVDRKRHQGLSVLVRDVVQTSDLSICVEETIAFLKNKETLLDPNSRAFHLMRALAPMIGFAFEEQSAFYKKSPQNLRDSFCASLEVYFTPQSQVVEEASRVGSDSLDLF